MIVLKKIIRYFTKNLSRFLTNKYFTLKFLFKGVIVRKPLHINLLKNIKIGIHTTIDTSSRLDCYRIGKQNEPSIIIGKRTMIGFNFTALSSSNLIIGDDCLIASYVFITTENHGCDPSKGKYINQELITSDVIIENNCWIGEKVSILPGVKIGEWSIIGANSVVTKSIPPYCMAVGCPAKIIKKYDLTSKEWLDYNE